MSQKIVTNLWFDTEAEAAADFYCSIFPDAKILSKSHYTENAPREAGMVMTVEWQLAGQRFVGINGGPQFTFDEAISLQIECDDQAEIDRYWDALLADGGEEGPCGWLKDKFGLSWQVTPRGMEDLFTRDPAAADRAMQAMLQMRKLDVAALERAAAGDSVTA